MPTSRVTPEQLRSWPKGQTLLALTAYDYPLARIYGGDDGRYGSGNTGSCAW